MRCLVYEPAHTGHYFNHVRHLLPRVTEAADDVVVVIDRKAVGSVEYRENLEPFHGSVRIEPAIDLARRSSGVGSAWQVACGFLKVLNHYRPDHVLVPYADGLSHILGMAPPVGLGGGRTGVESEGLLHRGSFAYPIRRPADRVKRALSLLAATRAPWTRLHFIDPLPYRALCRLGGSVADRVRLMPEAVEPMQRLGLHEARVRLGVPEDGRYIGCVGALNRRKGIDLLISAFAAASRRRTDRLLLVGRTTPDVNGLLHGEHASLVEAGQIIVIDRYVNDAELATALCCMDVVAAPYPRHIGDSGVAVRASAVGRPVLGSDFGWLRETIETFLLGWTCRVTNVDIFAAAIEDALGNAGDFALSEAGRRFVRFHTAESFASAWTVRLRERAGLPPIADRPTWDWVNAALGVPLAG